MKHIWAEEDTIGKGLEDNSYSLEIREELDALTADSAVEICRLYDEVSSVPIMDVSDPVARAQVYLKRSYLLSRQLGHSEDHNTAYIVEGQKTVVIPINDLVDRINLFTPMASLAQTLEMLIDPKDPDYDLALSLLNEDNYLAQTRDMLVRFINEIRSIIKAVEDDSVRLFFLLADRSPYLKASICQLTDLTQNLIELEPDIFNCQSNCHNDVSNLMKLILPLIPIFNELAECIRKLGRNAFDPSFTDMVHSDNPRMINGFYQAMIALMEHDETQALLVKTD